MRFLICIEDVTPCPEPSQAWVSLAEVLAEVVNPTLLGITPELALKFWLWGFGSVLLMWGLGYGIGLATGLIRKV